MFEHDLTAIFGETISTYSRADAIADGTLIDVSTDASEAGIKFPVCMTHAAYVTCVEWNEGDAARTGAYQDQRGRLWDVLTMFRHGAKRSSGDRFEFDVLCIPRDYERRSDRDPQATLCTLKAILGPGDTGEPVITILLPNED
jgi:hypothetical protein